MSPLVRKLEALFDLTDDERQVLESSYSQVVSFKPDQDIIHDGDRPKQCNVLLEGVVARYKVLRNGKRQILSFQFPGDIFDAQSFVLEVMDHSIVAIAPSQVGVIPHSKMTEITEDYPRIGRAIWKDTLVDAAVFREWMINVGQRLAHERIAHVMCEIYSRLSIVGMTDGDSIAWPITQQELGDALGLSNVHVNRSLQKLRGEGLITLSKGRLVIQDWAGLKRLGDFDPTYLHVRSGKAQRLPHGGNGDEASPLS